MNDNFPTFFQAMGKRIRAARKKKGIGLRELARKSYMSSAHLSELETGKSSAGAGKLWSLSEQLGVTIDFIVKGEVNDVPTRNA